MLSILLTNCNELSSNQKTEKSTVEKTKASSNKEKLLRHMVIFKFKDESSEEDINRLNDAFLSLPAAIPVIKDFEWGINNSPENFHQDFTHCYFITFSSEEDRDLVYTPHPSHQAFVDSLQDHIDKVFVVDYWTNP
jgi:hypothetical protein